MSLCADQTTRARWIGLQTLIFRECCVILRFWSHILAPPIIATVLYCTIFGEALGGRIGLLDGFEYLQYVAPGLVMMWVVIHAYGHTAGGLVGARFFRFLEEILVSPLPDWIVMMGYVLSGVMRGILVGTAVVITTLLFTRLHVNSLAASVAVLLLAAFVAALGGFIAALFARSFEQVYGIQTFILTPLMYVGGIFNSVAALPGWAQKLSLANPMFYIVNAFRYGLLGVSDVPIGVAVAMMTSAGLILCFAAVILLARGTGIRD